MQTAKDILIVVLLLVLVFMTCSQESDILDMEHRVSRTEGGLVGVYGGLVSVEHRLTPLEGGLDVEYFRSCSATLWVTEQHPITFQVVRGTGIFVSDNILLTAKHMVDERTGLLGVTVVGPDGVRYTAVEILEDTDDDLALIRIEGREGPWLEIGPAPVLGDDVICVGTPFDDDDLQLIITWGRVSSEKWKKNFIYDGFVSPGCSGGPVIVDEKLVGIVEAYLRNSNASLGFATPIERLDPGLRARF